MRTRQFSDGIYVIQASYTTERRAQTEADKIRLRGKSLSRVYHNSSGRYEVLWKPAFGAWLPSNTPTSSNPRRVQDRYYVGSAWWRDCDPFITIVSTTARKTEAALNRAMRSEARNAYDDMSYDRVSDALDDIAWSGVFAETPETVRRDTLSDREWEELLRDGIVSV